MNRKLPADAYAYYLSLGVERSYSKVAERFGVSKRAVLDAAKTERWQERVQDAEDKGRDKATEAYVESIQQMNERHLKVMRFILARSIDGMQKLPIATFAEAARAATVAIDRERLIRGEPTERTENVEAIIKREYERWLKPVGGGEADGAPSAGDSGGDDGATEGAGPDGDADGSDGDDARDAAA